MGKRELILLEEQTILSRERTMQQYIATGLAFISLGLIVLKLFMERYYTIIGIILVLAGFWQIYEAYVRFQRYRGFARKLRKFEKNMGLDIGE